MKYTSQIIVEVPINEFIKKLDDHANKKHWQEGLVSYEHINGSPGSVGCKMKLNYTLGKKHLTLIETLTESKLPKNIHYHYDTKGLHNVQKNIFKTTPKGHTVWVCENEFIPTTFEMRIFMLLSSSSLKKQTKGYLTAFKNFAENNISLINETT